jgi:hypothetical protein
MKKKYVNIENIFKFLLPVHGMRYVPYPAIRLFAQ